jgi:hypothetical protein
MSQTRRLAAILAADVVGYSRLMGADEEGTHERLKAHLRELLNSENRAQLFSAESGTACAAAWKPIFEWVPSQNGFFVDAPQRHSTVLS